MVASVNEPLSVERIREHVGFISQNYMQVCVQAQGMLNSEECPRQSVG